MAALSRIERGILALVVVLTAAAGIADYERGVSHIIGFVLAAVALAGLAWIVSLCTEQIGMRYGAGVTGTLQSTVGNLPEFFVVLFALQARDTTVAETAILGSILVNALLVLGVVLIAGSVRSDDGIMRFRTRLPQDATTLLLVASFIIVLLGLVNHSGNAAASHTSTISIVGAIVLLLVYGVWMRQYLTSAEEGPGSDDTRRQTPRLAMRPAIGLLVVAGAGSAFVSDWFVNGLEPTIHAFHISQAFAGLVIVAIAGNAVENVAGIVLAYKGEANLAISVVKNSVAQIAAFLYPLLVLVSLLTASRLTFSLAPVYIGALIGTAILVWQITGDGEATPFEGAALIATFLVIATVALYEH